LKSERRWLARDAGLYVVKTSWSIGIIVLVQLNYAVAPLTWRGRAATQAL
jgi:hypothetical protein